MWNTAAQIQRHLVGAEVDVTHKPDGPTTTADVIAEDYLRTALASFHRDTPFLGEETRGTFAAKDLGGTYWCADPIDGTNTLYAYLKGHTDRTGSTINLAKIHNGEAVEGYVLYFHQDRNTLYFNRNGKAYKQQAEQEAQELPAIKPFDFSSGKDLRVCVSPKENAQPEKIAGMPYKPVIEIGGGRMLKVATGEADIAWMDFPAKFWDVAAAEAILKAAGGVLVSAKTGKPLRYDQDLEFNSGPTIAGHLDTLIRLGFTKAEYFKSHKAKKTRTKNPALYAQSNPWGT